MLTMGRGCVKKLTGWTPLWLSGTKLGAEPATHAVKMAEDETFTICDHCERSRGSTEQRDSPAGLKPALPPPEGRNAPCALASLVSYRRRCEASGGFGVCTLLRTCRRFSRVSPLGAVAGPSVWCGRCQSSALLVPRSTTGRGGH
jgi:hypothetical protein